MLDIEIYIDKSRGLLALKRLTLIVYLKDSMWITVHLLMLLFIKEINPLSPSVHRIIYEEKL